MKKVKEYLNEKFESDTDPVADLGVGGVAFGVLKHDMREELEKRFDNTIRELLEGKTVSGTMNQNIIMKKDPRTGSLETSTGKGWGKYTIKIDILPKKINIEDMGIPVYVNSGPNEVTAYIIPFDESKIYIHK